MADKEKGCWFTTKTGVHVFVKDGQTAEEAIEERFGNKGKEAPKNGVAAKKMTPAEKIASVHIDFDKDNVLPELEEKTLKAMGVKKGKRVLLKASTIKRNLGKHFDVSESTLRDIVAETLYNPIDVFPANPDNPDYFHIAAFVEVEGKDGLKMGLVLLDVDKGKEYFEIGHAYFVDGKGFEKARKKAQKKG